MPDLLVASSASDEGTRVPALAMADERISPLAGVRWRAEGRSITLGEVPWEYLG